MIDKEHRNIVVIEVDTLFRGGTIRDLVNNEAREGRANVIYENVSELDLVIGGDVDLSNPGMYGSHLCGTESLLFSLRDDLYRKGFSAIELRDTNAILKFLSGANGFLNCHDVVQHMKDYELGFIASWLCVFGKLNYESFDSIKVGVVVEDEEAMDVKVADIIDSYRSHHKMPRPAGNNEEIKVVPNSYWIHELIKKYKAEEE